MDCTVHISANNKQVSLARCQPFPVYLCFSYSLQSPFIAALPLASRAETISASRVYSLSMSHKTNNPGCNSLRISAGRTHSGSFRTSKYAWRMHATCLDSGRARDSGFDSSVEGPCTRTKVLAERRVRRRERSLLSSTPSG
jgi:hypothetical protein